METTSRVMLSQVFRKNSIAYIESRTKSGAIEECIQHLIDTERLRGTRADKVAKSVLDREKLGSTGIGEGVAVPHGELEFLKSFLGVLGISKEGVEYRSIDGRRVHYIFLFLTPTNRRAEHQQLLRDIVTFVREGHYLKFLRNAEHPEEIHDLIVEMEQEQ